MFELFRRLVFGRSVPAPPVDPPSEAERRELLAPTPPVPCWCTALYSPRAHAKRLLWWLRAVEPYSGELLAADLQAVYRSMCLELNWAVRPWNPVARKFTKLTTGRKIYRWFLDPEDGTRHRLSVYPAPTPSPEALGIRIRSTGHPDLDLNQDGFDLVPRPNRRAGLGRSR
jgi:hypothetical protein